MGIYGLMVTRNEAERYLTESLAHLIAQTDGVLVYDDQSTDRTVAIACALGATVAVRDGDTPTFTEHEGLFRQTSWDCLTEEFELMDGDWVIVLDADEFLIGERADIESVMEMGTKIRATAANIHIHEVFGLDGDIPLIREDGFWPQITGNRFVAFQPRGEFPDKTMACGVAPTYTNSKVMHQEDVCILHYGYATKNDREAKYARYTSLNHNHNPVHIESILRTPMLRPWNGAIPFER